MSGSDRATERPTDRADDRAADRGQPSSDTSWRRFVALGDSFTEGMCDPAAAVPPGGNPWRGWADRVAEALAQQARSDGRPFEYANLAIRGRLLTQIVDEQLPVALELEPDLVSIVGGGNDVLRPGTDLDTVAARLEDAVARLRATGATVLMATPYDPGRSALLGRTRGPAGVSTAHVWSIARRHGALVLDLWGMRALKDRRMWAEDRIHLAAEGHRRVAAAVLDLLGVDQAQATGTDGGKVGKDGTDGGKDGMDGGRAAKEWEAPLDPLPARRRQEAWREDAVWVREHVVPWVGRRLRGRSSGDGLTAKRPRPEPVP